MSRLLGLAAHLRSWGLAVIEEPGWEKRGRDRFSPVGVVVHHTGPGGVAMLVRLCIGGRADLPGPLCHVLLAPDGACHLIASGVANHAGAGKWRGVSGNSRFVGIEAVNAGDGRWAPEQLAVYPRLCAAILELIGQDDVRMVCAHREYAPKRKVDPAGINMDEFRQAIAGHRHVPHSQKEESPPVKHAPPIVMEPWAASWRDQFGNVIAAASEDGDIYAFGTPWVGNVSGKPYWGTRKVSDLGPRDDGQPGYMVTAVSHETYRLPDGLDHP